MWYNTTSLTTWKEYDGVALYFVQRDEEVPQNKGIRFAEKPIDYIQGYSLLQKLQYRSYWKFWYPSQYMQLPIKETLTAHIQESTIRNDDFINGSLQALDVWIPKSESKRREFILQQIER